MPVTKKLLLGTFKDLYPEYKEKYPHTCVGFTTFFREKPLGLVYAGQNGTHNVCVCQYHENCRLLLFSLENIVDIRDIIQENEPWDYKTILKYFTCDKSEEDCWLYDDCEDCKMRITALEDNLFCSIEADDITFSQWQSTDRTQIINQTSTKEEFIKLFIESFQYLKYHNYVKETQVKYFYKLKESLEDGEALAVGDFSENFQFIIQDAIQGVHWSNDMATLHPFVVYFKDQSGNIDQKSIVFISDDTSHNQVQVWTFQKYLIRFLKDLVPGFRRIFYYSDGCSAQYKNKKSFLNLLHHKKDFGIEAGGWFFWATSHGKGPWDGLAGQIKYQATKESLIRPPNNPLITAYDLYEFAKNKFKTIQIDYVSEEEILNDGIFLQTRFAKVKKLKGTRTFHSYEPVSLKEIKTKVVSLSENYQNFVISS